MINVIHYPETNSVEVTWLDDEGKQTRCHSYADVQMDMLQADLGAYAATHAELIAAVVSGIQPYTPPPTVIPTTVSMAQARLALHQLNLLESVEAGISSMGKVAQIEWEFRATVQRDSALVSALAAALQLDTQALDDLFILAGTL